MRILLIFIFPLFSLGANWASFPDDGFTYSRKDSCEAKSGRECFLLDKSDGFILDKETVLLEQGKLIEDSALKKEKEDRLTAERAAQEAKKDKIRSLDCSLQKDEIMQMICEDFKSRHGGS